MHKHNFLLSLITVMTILASAEAKGARGPGGEGEIPRLVVNILIDQLRSDYLETFSPLYGDGGFRQLMRGGRYYTQAVYAVAPRDRAVAAATWSTGAAAAEHGIVGERFLHRATLRATVAVDDPTVQGRGTTDRFRPPRSWLPRFPTNSNSPPADMPMSFPFLRKPTSRFSRADMRQTRRCGSTIETASG